MICKQCGEEIAEGSKCCESCGARQTPKKPVGWAVVLIVLCAILSISVGRIGPGGGNGAGEYVDLGLPSGTKWKAVNEEGGFYTYEESVKKFGDKLPTKEQMEELKDRCVWTWADKGYKVTGPNGNSIFLPAAGDRICDGGVYGVGYDGNYWSSTSRGSGKAWCLYFYSDDVGVYGSVMCEGYSIRLVQD